MRRALLAGASLLATTLVIAIGCGSSGASSTSTQRTAGPAPEAPHQPARRHRRRRPADWPTYHADLARTGVDRSSPRLGRMHRAWSRHLDGQVYAEPLAVGSRVYAATENNTVYALSAHSGQVIWRRHLGPPVDASTLPCGNIEPVTGITGTPAISHGTLYAVAFLSGYRHVLFALELKNGGIRWQRDVDAPGSDPRVHQERAALSVANGNIYVPYGGLFGDCGNYKGRVVGVPTGGGGLLTFTVDVGREGGIWAPSGAAVDKSGDLFVSTGNGDSSEFDFGDSVLRLSPALDQTGFFRPPNGGQLNEGDTDLGSVGPTLVSHDRLFAIGKEGVGVLLSTSALGGVGGQLDQKQICDGAYGGLAYRRPLVYVPCVDGLFALRLHGSRFGVAWRSGGAPGPPIVGGGAVWEIDQAGATLNAFAPRSGKLLNSVGLGSVTHFATPSAGGGRLFAPANDRVIAFAGV
jgi:outer membrane protein assembly factor BamB